MSFAHQELLERAVNGDQEAIGALLLQYGPGIAERLRIDSRHATCVDRADIMQVTYLEAFLRIRQFDPARGDAFEHWLLRIADNNLRDAIRAQQAQKQPPPRRKIALDGNASGEAAALWTTLTSGDTSPSNLVRADEACDRLHNAIERLPPDYARTVRLYDLEGRTIEEVCATLGRSSGAVYMLRARAHDRLRELLGLTTQIF